MTNRSYRWLFWMLALVGLSVDQVSKYGVFAWLYDEERLVTNNQEWDTGGVNVIPGAFDIVASYTKVSEEPGQSPLSFLRTISGKHLPQVNTGALFGTKLFFSGSSSNFVFAIVSFLAAAGIIYWTTRAATTRDLKLCLALGLILGGTLGNLYDRIVFGGVRDFLYWYKGVNWPVFNIADCCLVCGAGILLLEAFFAKSEASNNKPAEVAAVSNANSVS
jgi:signal peptidase II